MFSNICLDANGVFYKDGLDKEYLLTAENIDSYPKIKLLLRNKRYDSEHTWYDMVMTFADHSSSDKSLTQLEIDYPQFASLKRFFTIEELNDRNLMSIDKWVFENKSLYESVPFYFYQKADFKFFKSLPQSIIEKLVDKNSFYVDVNLIGHLIACVRPYQQMFITKDNLFVEKMLDVLISAMAKSDTLLDVSVMRHLVRLFIADFIESENQLTPEMLKAKIDLYAKTVFFICDVINQSHDDCYQINNKEIQGLFDSLDKIKKLVHLYDRINLLYLEINKQVEKERFELQLHYNNSFVLLSNSVLSGEIYTYQQLISGFDLIHEGLKMQHCIGKYDRYRDSALKTNLFNKGHFTMFFHATSHDQNLYRDVTIELTVDCGHDFAFSFFNQKKGTITSDMITIRQMMHKQDVSLTETLRKLIKRELLNLLNNQSIC